MTKKDKKKAEKKATKKSQKKRQSAKQKKAAKKAHKRTVKKKKAPFGLKLFKLFFILGLWGFIILGGIVLWYAAALPAIMETPQFEHRTALTVKANDGTVLLRHGETKGQSISVDELPPHLIYAITAIEDRRFYQHFGVDPQGLLRAFSANLRAGKTVQGGSTITQQLAKNLFLSPERTLKRKVQEALLALWLERELTKDEILSAYLNRVYLGAGCYGVEAAAQTYFNKSSRALSLYESAMIAGLLKAPSRYNPHASPSRAKKRTAIVLKAMKDAGYITAQTASSAPQLQIATTPQKSRRNINYFGDWVVNKTGTLMGAIDQNLTIETTLDRRLQKYTEKTLENALNTHGEEKKISQGAIILMDKSGAILTMVGGRSYRASQFNRATQARRAPGSAFKPFVYAAALEKGLSPYDTILDAPLTEGSYRPENFSDEYRGTVTLEEALTYSLNTPAVRLMQQTGISKTIALARKAGIQAPLNRDLSLALGSSGIPLIEMVQAYGALANQGRKIWPYALKKITNTDGEIFYSRSNVRADKQALSPATARHITEMLEKVVSEGTGKRAALSGISAAGKTGTSQDYRDAWFIGYTDRYICGVWLGNDDNSPMDHVTGGALPAQIWQNVMKEAHKHGGPPPLSKPKNGFSGLLDRMLGQD